jgi:hypothetical protein
MLQNGTPTKLQHCNDDRRKNSSQIISHWHSRLKLRWLIASRSMARSGISHVQLKAGVVLYCSGVAWWYMLATNRRSPKNASSFLPKSNCLCGLSRKTSTLVEAMRSAHNLTQINTRSTGRRPNQVENKNSETWQNCQNTRTSEILSMFMLYWADWPWRNNCHHITRPTTARVPERNAESARNKLLSRGMVSCVPCNV